MTPPPPGAVPGGVAGGQESAAAIRDTRVAAEGGAGTVRHSAPRDRLCDGENTGITGPTDSQ